MIKPIATLLQLFLLLFFAALISCELKTARDASQTNLPILGTWKLISGTLIAKGDTTTADYTKNVSFIKIINATHFAFLHHDLTKGKDSIPVFSSGGGTYSLMDSVYTEHLEYCSDRNWEGNDFKFTISLKNDTLIQTGTEKIESLGVARLNIEKYVRVKK